MFIKLSVIKVLIDSVWYPLFYFNLYIDRIQQNRHLLIIRITAVFGKEYQRYDAIMSTSAPFSLLLHI